MQAKPDPNAKGYKTICPQCGNKHFAKNYMDCICGIQWHKDDCRFVHDGVYTTFDAYPVYSFKYKIINFFKRIIGR